MEDVFENEYCKGCGNHIENCTCEKCFHEYLGHRLNAEKWVADLNA